MSPVRVANAPLSYGAFEVTVERYPNLPGADELLAAMSAAGYEGTELGPPGYLGEGEELRERLERHGMGMAGAFVPMRFSDPDGFAEDLSELDRTLALLAAAEATDGRPVLADAGSRERVANPGRGGEDRSLGLDDAGWQHLADGVSRAAAACRERGFEPTFHHHTSSYVEASWEIERLMYETDVGMLLDTGHLLIGGGDPVLALSDWGERINHVHIKDVRLDVLRGVVEDRTDMIEAWRRGIFCELGAGDVDLPAFFDALSASRYSGWLVVEQDRIPRHDEQLAESADAQERNRRWLSEHAGL